MAEADLSKIVNLIMENPKLIEEIKNLASRESAKDEVTAEAASNEAKEITQASENESAEVNTYPFAKNDSRARRNGLLAALKPYVSEKRCQAIDSMMSIADILDVVRSR